MLNVFISYAEEDSASANQVCQTTERLGLKCWMAPRDVRAGDEWVDAIDKALRDCAAVVVLLSASAQKSVHVKRELNQAITYDKRIFPYRLDNVPIGGGFAYLLSTVHWVDRSTTNFDSFAGQLKRVLDGRPEPVLVSKPRNHGSPAPEFPNLDELTRNRGRFSVRNIFGKMFDDK